MMTFLELVNTVERESGTVHVSQRTTDVASPGTNRQDKMIGFVQEAYRQIQLSRSDWPWRQVEFSHALVIGQARYSASDLGITSFSRWASPNDEEEIYRVYDPAIGVSDENCIDVLPYGAWRESFDKGSHDAQRPGYVTFDRANKLCVGPKPDKAYILRGVYQRGVSTLLENDDVPILPDDHHMVIAWKALQLCHGHDEGQFALGNATVNYTSGYRTLVNDCLPMLVL